MPKKTPCEKAAQKVAKYLKKCPEIIKGDSSETVKSTKTNVNVNLEFEDSSNTNKMQSKVDTILKIIIQECPEINYEEIRKELSKIYTVENVLGVINWDSAGFKIKVYAKVNKTFISLSVPKETIEKTKNKSIIMPCPECPKCKEWTYMDHLLEVWIIPAVAIFLLIGTIYIYAKQRR